MITRNPFQTNLLKDEIGKIQVQEEEHKHFTEKQKLHIKNTFCNSDSGVWTLALMMVLGRCFESINTGNAQTYALSGGQDFVNAIADLVYEVDPQTYHAAIDLVKGKEFRPMQIV